MVDTGRGKKKHLFIELYSEWQNIMAEKMFKKINAIQKQGGKKKKKMQE